ncbi:MAG: 60S ribosomal protein L13 [Sclerophora amabilis]|nr:MAG: 60S ribosomal protein L13 [Sclerophora amabilis]
MTIKHNQQIQHNLDNALTECSQPGSKKRRRLARHAKAAAVAPKPVDKLRPIVHCPTIKYNRRIRAGRGFTLAELKEAGIPRKLAPTIGISVDHRRQNLSEESLVANVDRLKSYRARVILFPRRAGKQKQGDASAEEVKAAKNGENIVRHTGAAVPIENLKTKDDVYSEVKVSDLPKGEESAYRRLRDARSDARLVGVREKRARIKAEEAQATKK